MRPVTSYEFHVVDDELFIALSSGGPYDVDYDDVLDTKKDIMELLQDRMRTLGSEADQIDRFLTDVKKTKTIYVEGRDEP